MKQTSKRLSSILLALLLVAIAGVVYFELVQPEYANLMALKGSALSQRNLLANEQMLVKQAQGVLGSYQGQSSSTRAVNLAMPVGANNALTIAQIYGLATNSGLSIQNMGISLATAPQSPDNTGAAPASAAALVKPVGSITFQISANGTYEALKTFLQGLENNVRVFDVTSLTIRPATTVTNSGATPNTAQDLYNYNFTATTYYQSP